MAGAPEEVARLLGSSSEDQPGPSHGTGRTHGECMPCDDHLWWEVLVMMVMMVVVMMVVVMMMMIDMIDL